MADDIIIRAFEFAYQAHSNTKRKGSTSPYITHPMTVATILMRHNLPDEIIAASLLHDVVEDENITFDEIQGQFGEEVCFYVRSVTEPPSLDNSPAERKRSWKTRKRDTINSLITANKNVKMLSCADKVANLSDMERDLANQGDKLWTRFNAPKSEQRWYYHSLMESYISEPDSLKDSPLYKEFCTLVGRIFFKNRKGRKEKYH